LDFAFAVVTFTHVWLDLLRLRCDFALHVPLLFVRLVTLHTRCVTFHWLVVTRSRFCYTRCSVRLRLRLLHLRFTLPLFRFTSSYILPVSWSFHTFDYHVRLRLLRYAVVVTRFGLRLPHVHTHVCTHVCRLPFYCVYGYPVGYGYAVTFVATWLRSRLRGSTTVTHTTATHLVVGWLRLRLVTHHHDFAFTVVTFWLVVYVYILLFTPHVRTLRGYAHVCVGCLHVPTHGWIVGYRTTVLRTRYGYTLRTVVYVCYAVCGYVGLLRLVTFPVPHHTVHTTRIARFGLRLRPLRLPVVTTVAFGYCSYCPVTFPDLQLLVTTGSTVTFVAFCVRCCLVIVVLRLRLLDYAHTRLDVTAFCRLRLRLRLRTVTVYAHGLRTPLPVTGWFTHTTTPVPTRVVTVTLRSTVPRVTLLRCYG